MIALSANINQKGNGLRLAWLIQFACALDVLAQGSAATSKWINLSQPSIQANPERENWLIAAALVAFNLPSIKLWIWIEERLKQMQQSMPIFKLSGQISFIHSSFSQSLLPLIIPFRFSSGFACSSFTHSVRKLNWYRSSIFSSKQIFSLFPLIKLIDWLRLNVWFGCLFNEGCFGAGNSLNAAETNQTSICQPIKSAREGS